MDGSRPRPRACFEFKIENNQFDVMLVQYTDDTPDEEDVVINFDELDVITFDEWDIQNSPLQISFS